MLLGSTQGLDHCSVRPTRGLTQATKSFSFDCIVSFSTPVTSFTYIYDKCSNVDHIKPKDVADHVLFVWEIWIQLVMTHAAPKVSELDNASLTLVPRRTIHK